MTNETRNSSSEKPVAATGEPLGGFAPARYCWLLPLFGLGASMVLNFLSHSTGRLLGIAGFFIFALSIVVGFVLSVVCLVKAGGHKRTLAHGIAGLAVNVLFVALIVFMFFAIAKVREAAKRAEARRQQKAPGAAVQPRQPATPLSGPPEIASECEGDGFQDLAFWIQDYKQLPDGSQTIRASGLHKGQSVAVEFVLGSSWKGGSPDKGPKLQLFRGMVACRSIGPESDAFCQALDALYGTKIGAQRMAKEVWFTGISLQGSPGNPASGPLKIKLFRESENDDYAEAYFNVELKARRCEFHEKDPEYRAPLVRAFRAPESP